MTAAPAWMAAIAQSRRHARRSGNWVTGSAPAPISDTELLWRNIEHLDQPYREKIAGRFTRLGPLRFIDDPDPGVGSS